MYDGGEPKKRKSPAITPATAHTPGTWGFGSQVCRQLVFCGIFLARSRWFKQDRTWISFFSLFLSFFCAVHLRGQLADDGVRVATISEDDDLRELSVSNLRESLRVARLEVHGRRRVGDMPKLAVTAARAQESKLRAAAKRDINAAMARSPRGDEARSNP